MVFIKIISISNIINTIENKRLKPKKDFIKIKLRSTCHNLSSNMLVHQFLICDPKDHLMILQIVSKFIYLKDPQIPKFIKTIITKLLSIISYYSESDPIISINACATMVNAINYSIKICPEMEQKLVILINSQLDFSVLKICFSMIKFLNYNLQSILQNINKNMELSQDDEMLFKNMMRVKKIKITLIIYFLGFTFDLQNYHKSICRGMSFSEKRAIHSGVQSPCVDIFRFNP